MLPQEISDKIKILLPNADVRVNDYTGGGEHFEAIVMSDTFSGMTRVKRHQMVYKALGDSMKSDIHALALKTVTMEEFQKLASKS